ncbi:hypothetical protein ElyMa_006386900 [Elysia marginata]|uniref:Cysteine-rich transmembrane CYSTM domain-containing protein n=1 Tax=Elysia marginata TaxID=1093978 RepID=A0AAV4HRG0_9GAST|nr:hypothetical protein ElyMa_006386900 [Elysia marginata]
MKASGDVTRLDLPVHCHVQLPEHRVASLEHESLARPSRAPTNPVTSRRTEHNHFTKSSKPYQQPRPSRGFDVLLYCCCCCCCMSLVLGDLTTVTICCCVFACLKDRDVHGYRKISDAL